jgi:short-subunit dehydrogenase
MMTKHIIVTGSSRGIGYETSLYLANKGCQVTAIARSESKLEELKGKGGENIQTLAMDITEVSAGDHIVNYLHERNLPVDGLIHNAGLLIKKPFEETTDRDWELQLNINLMAPVRITRSLLPMFSKGAHILNISSMGGFQGSSKFPGLAAYSVSKGALSILTECLGEELIQKDIYTNCLCLGAVQTEMLEQAFPGYDAPVQSEEMGRYIGEFILSGHRYYNGKILPVATNNPT